VTEDKIMMHNSVSETVSSGV